MINNSSLFRRLAVLLLCVMLLLSACQMKTVLRSPEEFSKGEEQEQTPAIVLNFEKKTLAPDERFALIPTITPLPDYTPAFFFTSSDKEIAEVDEEGLVTAKALGNCTITVSTLEGTLRAVCKVTVNETGEEPSSPDVSPSPSPTPSEEPTVSPSTDIPPDSPTPPVSEESPSEEPPSEDPPEEIIPIEGLELIGPTDAFVGIPCQFTVKVTPENATEKYYLHNSNTRDSTLTKDGVLTPSSKSKTTITVDTEDGRISDSITVNLLNYITGVAFDTTPKTIYVGQTLTFQTIVLPEGTAHQGVYYANESRNMSGKIEVKSDGLTCNVTGVKVGRVGITIGSRDFPNSITKTYYFNVVEDPRPSLKFSEESVSLHLGQSSKLTPTVKNTSKAVLFECSDPEFLQIEEDGTMIPLKEGTVIVTASIPEEELTAQCTVTVLPHLPEITLERKELSLPISDSASCGAALLYAQGTLLYSSSDDTVASVDENGLITAHSAGTATITVTLENTQTSVTLTVNVPEPEPEPEPEPDPEPDPEPEPEPEPEAEPQTH